MQPVTAGRSFLVAAQETNQRKRLGDALAAKSFVTAIINRHSSPDFEPPSPRPLPGPRRWTGCNRIFSIPRCMCLMPLSVPDHSDYHTLPTSAGRGTQGRAARSRGKMVDYLSCFDRLRGQRLPCAGFFWSFSCRDKKRTYHCIYNHLSLEIKVFSHPLFPFPNLCGTLGR